MCFINPCSSYPLDAAVPFAWSSVMAGIWALALKIERRTCAAFQRLGNGSTILKQRKRARQLKRRNNGYCSIGIGIRHKHNLVQYTGATSVNTHETIGPQCLNMFEFHNNSSGLISGPFWSWTFSVGFQVMTQLKDWNVIVELKVRWLRS